MERLVSAMERSATAQEDLIRLATEERDEREEGTEILQQLPVCPHCGTLNPGIRNEGGSGPFADFVLLAFCDNCTNTFVAEPLGWNVFKDKKEYEGREVNGNGTRSDTRAE